MVAGAVSVGGTEIASRDNTVNISTFPLSPRSAHHTVGNCAGGVPTAEEVVEDADGSDADRSLIEHDIQMDLSCDLE